jgi:Ca2+-binding RTX toxin-like protein
MGLSPGVYYLIVQDTSNGYSTNAPSFPPQDLSVSYSFSLSLDFGQQPNHAPVANADSFTTSFNTVLTRTAATGVLANDSDQDGNSLTVSSLTNPSHGTLQLFTDGSFTYTPFSNYSGSDSFTYFAFDGIANSTSAATVSLTVNGSTNNFFSGTPGPDVMDQGIAAGIQVLDGLAGNDTYIVDNAGDVVIEGSGPNSGTDTIASLAASYTLPANVETLVLAGSGNISGTGNGLNNLMIGNDGANTLNGVDGNDALAGAGGNDSLIGGLGDDFLDGGAGNDTMDGGAGNDFYVVDSFGDLILPEGTGPGSGTDVVASAVSFVLGAGLEVLVMAPSAFNGTGNALDNTIFANDAPNILLGGGGVDVLAGGGGNDIIDGGLGNDVLMGGAGTDSLLGGAGDDYLNGELGNDTLVGGDGNDLYIIDSPFDVVVEGAGSVAGTSDIVASTKSYALAANVETLILVAGFGNIDGAGNVLSNLMIGNDGDNTLDGQSGNDTIGAAEGNDRLLGGYGDDFLVGGAGNNSPCSSAASGAIPSPISPRDPVKAT